MAGYWIDARKDRFYLRDGDNKSVFECTWFSVRSFTSEDKERIAKKVIKDRFGFVPDVYDEFDPDDV